MSFYDDDITINIPKLVTLEFATDMIEEFELDGCECCLILCNESIYPCCRTTVKG